MAKLEDLDPSLAKGPRQRQEVDTSALEALDPVFRRPPPRFEKNEEIAVSELPAAYQMVKGALIGESEPDTGMFTLGGAGTGAALGAAEQSRNIMRLFSNPKVQAAATEAVADNPELAKWLKNWAGIERSADVGGVPSQSQIYQRTKTHGKAGEKVFKKFGTDPLDILRQAEKAKETQAAAEAAARSARMAQLGEKASSVSRGLGYIPGLSVAAGGLGGYDIAEAMKRYESGDTPGALIQGVGGLGALASLLPHPVPRLLGGGLSLMSMPALYMYEAMTGKRPSGEPASGLGSMAP